MEEREAFILTFIRFWLKKGGKWGFTAFIFD
jgi:hypothetical protein